MKKILLFLVALLAMVSCEQGITNDTVNDGDTVQVSLSIPDSGTRSLSALTNPTVDYTILKDGANFKSGNDIALDNLNGGYTLDIALDKGATYVFTRFDVFEGTKHVYEFNPDVASNTTGFTVAADGTMSQPTVYLKYLIGDGYTDQNAGNLTINTDYREGSAVDLTFKVTIPQGLTVKLAQTNSSRSYITIVSNLTSGSVVDMDAFELYNPNNTVANYDNDNNVTTHYDNGSYSGYKDEFVFTVTEGTQSYKIYYTSAQLNKRNIIFKLGQQ